MSSDGGVVAVVVVAGSEVACSPLAEGTSERRVLLVRSVVVSICSLDACSSPLGFPLPDGRRRLGRYWGLTWMGSVVPKNQAHEIGKQTKRKREREVTRRAISQDDATEVLYYIV